MTTEYYIGGRKSNYVKPYFIGKVLNIIELNTGKILLENIEDYTFNFIKLKGVKDDTNVVVTHLGVPPHYQMGGMTYINRIKQDIVKRYNEQYEAI